MFPRRNTIGAFAFGVGTTSVLFLVLGADKAQTQPTAPLPRYQISSWSLAQKDQNTGESYGAYRVDTHTGDVTAIVGTMMFRVQDAR
jgi:hypothetical protein